MKTKTILLSCTIVMLLGMQVAQAETLIFNTSDNPFDLGVDNQGWWSDTTAITDRLSDNYGTGVSITGDHRSFFSFDLSSLSMPVISATLELTRFEYFSSAESEILGLFDVSTDVVNLNDNSSINATIYEDLGAGDSYGQFDVSADAFPTDVLSFELNTTAISDINSAAGGWFSIGGSLLSLGSPTQEEGVEVIFGGSSGEGIQRLVLEVIPEPLTVVLLGMGSIALRYRTRGNR